MSDYRTSGEWNIFNYSQETRDLALIQNFDTAISHTPGQKAGYLYIFDGAAGVGRPFEREDLYRIIVALYEDKGLDPQVPLLTLAFTNMFQIDEAKNQTYGTATLDPNPYTRENSMSPNYFDQEGRKLLRDFLWATLEKPSKEDSLKSLQEVRERGRIYIQALQQKGVFVKIERFNACMSLAELLINQKFDPDFPQKWWGLKRQQCELLFTGHFSLNY